MAVKYMEEQLNNVDKSFLVLLLLQQQKQLESPTKEFHDINEKMQKLMEQLVHSNQERFERSSEKMEDTSQTCFMEIDDNIVFLMKRKLYVTFHKKTLLPKSQNEKVKRS